MADSSDAVKSRTLYDILSNETDTKIQKEIANGKRIGLYRIKKQLGTGCYGKVKLAIHLLTNESVAIKIIDKGRLDCTTCKILSSEISCMERLSHPNLVRLYEVIERHQSLNIIMECALCGSLLDKINDRGPIEERLRRDIFIQIASAIKYMHNVGVIHRDLKADNIFFNTPTTIKLGDFGFSTLAGPNKYLDTFCGSPAYSSPELFRSESYLGSTVDIWALGVLLYFMSTGNVPFRGDTIHDIKVHVLAGIYHIPDSVSEYCGLLITGMLRFKAVDRYNMIDIDNSLWVQSKSKGLNESSQCIKCDSVDQSILLLMKEYGVPLDDTNQLLGQPRTPVAGIYRILLQQKIDRDIMGDKQDNNVIVKRRRRWAWSSGTCTCHPKMCTIL